MTSKLPRRTRYAPTGELRKRSTRPLGETGLLREHQPSDQLLAQVDKLLAETELLSARVAAISDVAVAVNSSLRIEEILEILVNKARHALGFEYCAVGLLVEGGDTYVIRALEWPEGKVPSPGSQSFAGADGLAGAVMSTGKPIMVQDLNARPLKIRPAGFLGQVHPDFEGKLTAAGISSLLVLPLKANGRTPGCLLFGKRETDYYNQDDMQLAYLFSMLLAAALRNSRLFDAEARRASQLQMLSEVGQTATSILDTATLLAKIPNLVQTYFGYDVVKVGLLDKEQVVYASNAQVISGCPHPTDVRLAVSRNGLPVGIVGLGVYTRETVLVPNVFEDDRWADVVDSLSGPHICSVLVIPMTARDRVLGVLHFESEKANAFGTPDVSILQSLASQLGVALDNARLYQQLNDLFHGYIAPQVASTLLDNPSNAELGGQRRDITVLFADLDGFTSLSEKVPPEELLELLNQCLGLATETILEYGGTLDKYMGDSVMALFNAPHDQPDHAWRAVKSAIAIQRKLQKLTANWKHKMIFSIGLNTGEAVVGNIGSSTLRNFTAIGDTVNLAKRIQETAAPGQILVNQTTYQRAISTENLSESGEGQFSISRLGTKPIKGRSQPATLYEVSSHVPMISAAPRSRPSRGN